MADESSSTALVPRAEQVVDFYGDPIVVAVVDDQAYVPLRSLTEFMGLTWPPQYQRIQRDEVLSKHVQMVEVTAADGKRYETLCLELPYLPGWLFGISANRVKDDIKETLLRYRDECFNILWRELQSTFKPPATQSQPTSTLEQVRGLALAIATLAEQQMALEHRVDEAGELATSAHARLDKAAEAFNVLQRRLSVVEGRVAPVSYISDEQAAQVSSAVKGLAGLLGEKDGKSHYQEVFSELYRRFGLSSYKLVRREQYEAVLQFLEEWRQRTLTN